MFRVSTLTIVCVVLVACVTTGCQKEEKFTIPENPAPWSPDLSPSGAGAGGGGGSPGGRQRRSRPSETEQQENQASDESQASEGDQSSEASEKSQEVDDKINSDTSVDQ